MSFAEDARKLRKERIARQSRQMQASQPGTKQIIPAEKSTFFQKGALKDGDVLGALVDSTKDVRSDLMAGVLGIGEKAVDAGAYLAGGIGKLFGAEDFAEKTKDFISKDLYDEKAVADKILGVTSGLPDLVKTLRGEQLEYEEGSVFGDKTDALAQSGGQMLGTAALQMVGVPWQVTSGVTSFGSETENAFKQGATYGQAGLSGLISAGAEILTEKLFGGSGLGEKGLIDMDLLTKGISNKLAHALTKFGLNMTTEGMEEVFSAFASNLGSALYREENLLDILWSEEAVDSYIDSFVSGMAMGGIANLPQTAGDVKAALSEKSKNTATQQPQRKPSLVDDIVNRITANRKNTATEASQSAEKTSQDYVDSLLDEVTAKATGAPADPVGAAVEAFKATGTVTNKQATDILNSVKAVTQIINETGIELPHTASGRRAVIKQAIADLAQKQAQPPVDTEVKTDYDNKNTQGGTVYADTYTQGKPDYSGGVRRNPQGNSQREAAPGAGNGSVYAGNGPQSRNLREENRGAVYSADSEGRALTQDQTAQFQEIAEQAPKYKASKINQAILRLVERVKGGLSTGTEKVQLNPVSDNIAAQIRALTGIDVRGYKVAVEARQIDHILKDHGENGRSDHSMADASDIAKMEYALEDPDSIVRSGTTRAYVTNKNGKMKPADTVLYEKQNGDGSYYVVQAVPDTNKKTLYIVTAFIGKSGYKNTEAPQSANANSPGATPEAESAVASNNIVHQTSPEVNPNRTPSPDESVGADAQSDYGPNTVGGAESKFKHEQRKSKLYTNTYANTADEAVHSVGQAAMEDNPHIADYDYVSEEESLHNARLRTRSARERGVEYTYLMKKDGWTGEDLDTSYELLKAFQKKGDTDRFHTLAAKQRSVLTNMGQAVQANAKYSRSATKAAVDAHEALDELRPNQVNEHYYVKKDRTGRNTFGKDVYYQTDTGKLAQDMKNMNQKETSVGKRAMKDEKFEQWKTSVSATILDVANAIENTAEGDVTAMREIVRSLARFRHTTAWFGTQSRLTRIAEKALQTVDFDTAKDIALAQLKKIPDDFKRRSVGQVVKTIRIHNMLGSLTTVNRNLSGNASIGVLDAVSDSLVGRLADIAVSRFTGKRTVGNDLRYVKEYFEGGKKAAEMAALATELDIPIGSESRFSTGTTRTFSPQGRGPVARYLSAFDKAMRYALEVSDRIFSGGTESAVEASLRDLGEKSNLSDDEIQALSARTGERRTFKDGRMLTKAAKDFKDALNNVGTGNIGAGDLVIPFAVTGTSVAHTAVDYSSGGLNGLIGIFRLVYDVKTGAYNSETGIKKVKGLDGKEHEVSLAEAQRRAVTNFGRGMTGVGLIAAFTALAAAGILKVHEDDDYDKNALEDSLGTSGAQINISAALRENSGESAEWRDGDICVGMDFLEPFNAHMYIGHALSQEEDFSELIKAYPRAIVSGIWKSLLDMPMMQSLSDLNDLFVSEDAVDASGQILGNLGSGFIPAALRQTAYMTDPYYRDTTGENAIEKAANQLKSYIPGLSQTLPKKYSGLGEEQLRHDSDVLGFFNTYINPGKISQISTSKIADSLDKISEATGNKAIYPDYIAPGSFTYTDENGNKQTVTISGKEMTEVYQKTYGSKVASLYSALLAMDEFDTLDAETKADILESAKSYATQLARAAVSDYSGIPAYIRDKPENMSEAEAFVRQKLVGTTTMYTDLSISSAAYVSDLIKAILPEEGKDSVRKIQKLEAVAAADDRLSQQEQRSAMEDIIGDNSILEKYTKILEMGYDNDDFVESYRIDLDIEGENAKERTIKEFMRELGLPKAAATKLYEAYHPPKKKGFQANLYT